jgi:hypothetical protein
MKNPEPLKNKINKSCPVCTSDTFNVIDVVSAIQYLRNKIQENTSEEEIIEDYWNLIDDAFPDILKIEKEYME